MKTKGALLWELNSPFRIDEIALGRSLARQLGTMDFTPGDWRRHYGAEWQAFKQAKSEFDPRNILTPGPGIFPKT